MTEFGHIATIGRGFCIDGWGAGPFIISIGERTWRFEDSDRFGPYILTKRDMPASRQPGERSRFWPAHRAWVQQSRRLAADGVTCIYDPLKPTVLRHIGGRHYLVIEDGDEMGGIEVEP